MIDRLATPDAIGRHEAGAYGEARGTTGAVRARLRRLALVAAGCLLVAAMIVPRVAVLGQSLWHDEIYTIQHYVSGGPGAIFGSYGTNDHMLFNVLAWLTVWLPGLPDALYRVWGELPFLVGVATVVLWLRVRAGSTAALVFAFLAAASPMLLELTTEARGYGLSFLAASVLVVSGHELAVAPGRRGFATLFCAAGVAGTWTVPDFALPFAGATAALVLVTPLRRPFAVRLGISAIAVAAWYAPTLGRLLGSTGQQYGDRLPWHTPITGGPVLFGAAFDLTPSTPTGRLVIVAVVVPLLLLGLWEASRTLPRLVAPTVAAVTLTFLALTVLRFYVEQRFLSYLLVPLFVYAGIGAQALLRRRVVAIVGWAALLAAGGAATVHFVRAADATIRLPFENNRAAAAAVAAATHGGAVPVVVNTHAPDDLRYYLPPSAYLIVPQQQGLERRLCGPHPHGLVFVQQPFFVATVSTRCLARAGAVPHRFRQRARGHLITVWVLGS